MALPIVHINGYPGVGKLTIARKLAELLHAPLNARLVHNHLLIDPAGAVLPRTSADYQPLRRALRAAVFNTLASSRDTYDSVYIFTDFQTTDAEGSAVMNEYHDLANRRGCMLIPVVLACSTDENLRRLVSTERSTHGKLTDTQLVASIRGIEEVFRWSDNPSEMYLDVTDMDVDQAAQTLAEHVLRLYITRATSN